MPGRYDVTGTGSAGLSTTVRTVPALGCTAPAAWCHVHHKTPWLRGGPTTVTDGTTQITRTRR
jgi:hypothetical protein